MKAASLWTYLAVTATYVSTYSVDIQRAAKVNAGAPGCGTVQRIPPPAPYPKRNNVKESVQPRQAGNSSVPLTVDVYMQIISNDGTEQGGDISDEKINAQMKILDDAFREVGFKFNLVDTTRTVNERWYYDVKVASQIEKDVLLAMRKGGGATLNVFTMGSLDPGVAAWATLPSSMPGGGEPYDGVFINGTVFLGGSDPYKSFGNALVHEVGHWFGLYHTFTYTCNFSFDYVDDTPYELQPESLDSCEVGRDSCPDRPGLDLITNYMSYSNDKCQNSWTLGQIQRMREQMAKFRGLVYPGIDVNNIPEDSI